MRIMHSSIYLFFLFSLLVLLLNPKCMCPVLLSSSFETKTFELRSLTENYLTLLGDSRFQYGVIALTKEGMSSTNSPRSAGVVFYRHPILFLDPHSKKIPSFYTMFAFSIENLYGDGEAFGDGLAFLISPNDNLLGSPGYLGLVDPTDLTRNKFIAIEFDTKCDSVFQDPDDNHIGLNINSLHSVKLATSSSLGMDLKSGSVISTWIDYKGNDKRLEVFLSKSYLKPKKPQLKVDIDLSDYLKENMFVGFSASTAGSMQLTHIRQWEFTSMGLSPPPPQSPPGLGRIFPSPSRYEHIQSDLNSSAIGLTIGACFLPFLVLCGWFYWKWSIGKIQQSEGTNNLQVQNIKPSRGISSQEILLSILVDEVARHLNIEKVSENDAEIKTVKSNIPSCNSLATVKPSILPGTDNVTSV